MPKPKENGSFEGEIRKVEIPEGDDEYYLWEDRRWIPSTGVSYAKQKEKELKKEEKREANRQRARELGLEVGDEGESAGGESAGGESAGGESAGGESARDKWSSGDSRYLDDVYSNGKDSASGLTRSEARAKQNIADIAANKTYIKPSDIGGQWASSYNGGVQGNKAEFGDTYNMKKADTIATRQYARDEEYEKQIFEEELKNLDMPKAKVDLANDLAKKNVYLANLYLQAVIPGASIDAQELVYGKLEASLLEQMEEKNPAQLKLLVALFTALDQDLMNMQDITAKNIQKQYAFNKKFNPLNTPEWNALVELFKIPFGDSSGTTGSVASSLPKTT